MKERSKYNVVCMQENKKRDNSLRPVVFIDGKASFPNHSEDNITEGICKIERLDEKDKYYLFRGTMVETEPVTYEQFEKFCDDNGVMPNGTYNLDFCNVLLVYGVRGAEDKYNPCYPLISINGTIEVVNWSIHFKEVGKKSVDWAERYSTQYIYRNAEEVDDEDVYSIAVRSINSLVEGMVISVYDGKLVHVESFYDKDMKLPGHGVSRPSTYVKMMGSVIKDNDIQLSGEVTKKLYFDDVIDYMADNFIGIRGIERDSRFESIYKKTVHFNNIEKTVYYYDNAFWNSKEITDEEKDIIQKSKNELLEFRKHCAKYVNKNSIFQLKGLSEKAVLGLE